MSNKMISDVQNTYISCENIFCQEVPQLHTICEAGHSGRGSGGGGGGGRWGCEMQNFQNLTPKTP